MNDQSSNNRESVDSWHEKVVSSCAHHDSEGAYSAWRKWDEMIGLVSPEQKSEIMYFQEQLTYTAFPSFPQDVAASLIEKHLVSFLRSSVDIDEMFRNRFLYLGYGFEEPDRKVLREAALKNTELVGEKAVSEWLGTLDTELNKAESPEDVMMQFFTQNQSVMALSRLDQAILRRLFQVYYDFLAFPVVTVYGLAESARKLAELEKAGVKEINLKEFFAQDKTAPREFTPDMSQNIASSRQGVATSSEKVSLPLLKALGKFEKLGGQQVTNSKIVVKGQNDPVRPTIFNWLRAYRDELGVGAHDAVTRGQFLFHSLNGKGLSSDERDQVGILLKSLDENSPLTIDAGRQEVIFSESRITNQESRIESKPLPALPLERGGGSVGNISRAVFEIPVMKNQESRIKNQELGNKEQEIQDTKYKIQNTNQGRLSAFEQAKAIQQANRESRLSISNLASETVELGKVDVSARGGQASIASGMVASRPNIASAPQNVAPAPRAISFEPAKIDTFSFGASTVATKPMAEKSFEPKFPVPEKSNVGSVSFSTKHVMQAEKEHQTLPHSVGTESVAGRQSTINSKQSVSVAPAAATPAQKPVAPVNRYRITPTSRREETVKDDTPSPHVVDLRN